MISEASTYGRDVLRGVFRYAHARTDWLIHATPDNLVSQRLRPWRPDGIICHAWPSGLPTLRGLRCPVVNTLAAARRGAWPNAVVTTDDVAIGKLAAEHFLDRGFRHFAFCGRRGKLFSKRRGEGFCQRLKAERVVPDVHEVEEDDPAPGRGPYFARSDAARVSWLRSLPKPVAAFACNDMIALQLAIACQVGGLDIPEEVALLGVGNEDVFCDRAQRPLSSIDLPGQQVGYRAAELLQHLMSGGKHPSRPILLSPRGVVTRASSDITAIEDAEVAAACGFIRDRFAEGIDTSDVVRAGRLSRRMLERRFKRSLGRTLAREITRVRIDHAKRLLGDTEMSMPQIAERIGLANAERLSVAFRRATGMTPSAYRRQSRF